MKAKLAMAAIAALFAAPAFAQEVTVSALADETGLSERHVAMVLGNRTAYAEYRYTYWRAKARFIDALGESRYQDLIAGRSITLADGRKLALTRARPRPQS